MGADRLPAAPLSVISITAKYGFVKPPGGAVLLLGLAGNLRRTYLEVLEGGVEHHNAVGEVGVGDAHPDGLSGGETGEGRSVGQI